MMIVSVQAPTRQEKGFLSREARSVGLEQPNQGPPQQHGQYKHRQGEGDATFHALPQEQEAIPIQAIFSRTAR